MEKVDVYSAILQNIDRFDVRKEPVGLDVMRPLVVFEWLENEDACFHHSSKITKWVYSLINAINWEKWKRKF